MPKKKKPVEENLAEEQGRQAGGAGSPRSAARSAARFAAFTLGSTAAVFALAWILLQGDRLLTSDSRLRLPQGDLESGAPAVEISGIRKASRAAVLRVFEPDRGRALFLLDPEARRRQLQAVEWVRDASVRRIWPNRVAVEIVEREPVAFIQTPVGASGSYLNPVNYKPMLIDADGMPLELQGEVPADLPLLTGVRLQEDVERRKVRVRKMLRLLEELKDYRGNILEVDVTDIYNLRITYQIGGMPLVLVLGDERFAERVSTLERNFSSIRDRLAPRSVLDISLHGRITIAGARGTGGP
jgi:cell division protein FtsQ